MFATISLRAISAPYWRFILLTAVIPQAVSGQPNEKEREALPLSAHSVTESTFRKLPEYVKWKDQDYDIETGIEVLMNVIRDHDQSADVRHRAMVGLQMLRHRLLGHSCLNELAKEYINASEAHKAAILVCFQGSGDPRGIPVYFETLDTERNMKLRLWAAGALAQWNIRRGVAELVDLVESKDPVPQPSRMFYVCDNAIDLFEAKNRLKGWGFATDEIRNQIESKTRDREEVVALYKAELKKWFVENEGRFPDWKPGDALPESAPSAKPEE
jgi:hypothetical protein